MDTISTNPIFAALSDIEFYNDLRELQNMGLSDEELQGYIDLFIDNYIDIESISVNKYSKN